jgi:hypothetical protein
MFCFSPSFYNNTQLLLLTIKHNLPHYAHARFFIHFARSREEAQDEEVLRRNYLCHNFLTVPSLTITTAIIIT